MDKSKKIMSVISILVICSLLIINAYLFANLNWYKTDYKQDVKEKYLLGLYLYCTEGNSNTIAYYEDNYNISLNYSTHNLLNDLCYKKSFDNVTYGDLEQQLFNITKE